MNARPDPRGYASVPSAANDGRSRFDVYRSECVSLTSTLFGGGDWHWRLKSESGLTLVDCGGYRNQAECLIAVEALRSQAGSASLFKIDPGTRELEPD